MAQLTTSPPSTQRSSMPSEASESPETLGRMAHQHSLRGALRWLVNLVPALALGLLVLAVWQIVTANRLVAAYLLPAPADVIRTFWHSLTDGLLVGYTLATLEESIVGFVLGACVAVPLGYGIARSRLVSRAIEPYLAASQAIPAVALAPLLVLWLPLGLAPIALLCALIVFFPAVVTTALSLRLLDREVLDAARTDGAGWWALLRHIELPLALSGILAGLRTSLTLSITGAVVGEFVVSDRGLGGLLNIARGNFDPALVFATLLMLALLATTLYLLARFVEWRVSYLEER